MIDVKTNFENEKTSDKILFYQNKNTRINVIAGNTN